MIIGLDLDHTVYGFPEFFREFILAMSARGHTFVCTSNHTQAEWKRDADILRSLGIPPELIDWSGLVDVPVIGANREDRQTKYKPGFAADCDIVFDDDADLINPHCDTPIFKTPRKKAADRKRADENK